MLTIRVTACYGKAEITYATQQTVLQVLKAVADLGRSRESRMKVGSALEAFSVDLPAKEPTIIVKLAEKCFCNTDEVVLKYNNRTEYYRVADLIALFFCDCPEPQWEGRNPE